MKKNKKRHHQRQKNSTNDLIYPDEHMIKAIGQYRNIEDFFEAYTNHIVVIKLNYDPYEEHGIETSIKVTIDKHCAADKNGEVVVLFPYNTKPEQQIVRTSAFTKHVKLNQKLHQCLLGSALEKEGKKPNVAFIVHQTLFCLYDITSAFYLIFADVSQGIETCEPVRSPVPLFVKKDGWNALTDVCVLKKNPGIHSQNVCNNLNLSRITSWNEPTDAYLWIHDRDPAEKNTIHGASSVDYLSTAQVQKEMTVFTTTATQSSSEEVFELVSHSQQPSTDQEQSLQTTPRAGFVVPRFVTSMLAGSDTIDAEQGFDKQKDEEEESDEFDPDTGLAFGTTDGNNSVYGDARFIPTTPRAKQHTEMDGYFDDDATAGEDDEN